MPTTFATSPPALGLPTVCPQGLAMLCALRFAHAEYEAQQSKTTRPVVTVKGEDAVVVTASTVQSVLGLLQRNRRGLDDSLSDLMRGEGASVEALAEAFIFPAFSFVLSSDDNLRRESTHASGWISSLTSWLPVSGANAFASVPAALDAAEKGLMALDRLLCAKGARIVDVNNTHGQPTSASTSAMYAATSTAPQLFILGTSTPTSADCFAYAAASLFLHGDLGSRCRDPVVLKWQVKMRQQFAILLNYVEGIRRGYFEDFAGTYALKAIPTLDDVNAENAVYKEGRWKTVVATVSFATLYFIVVNASLIVSLLGAGDDEGDAAAAQPQSAVSNAPQSSPQAPLVLDPSPSPAAQAHAPSAAQRT